MGFAAVQCKMNSWRAALGSPLTRSPGLRDNDLMRRIALVSVLLVLSAAIAMVDIDRRACAADDGEKSPRVILHVNRDTEVPGFLELEDADVIAIRNLRGQVESFPKARVLQIVRLTEPKSDQSGIVIMRDGQVREGIIVEDAFEYVLMEIHGIRAKLKRETVSHVVLQPTFEQRYAEYKAGLREGMYDAHLGLCRWLLDQRKYQMAREELVSLLEQTEMPDARKLLRLVDAQLALAQEPEREAGEDQPATQPESIGDSSSAEESSAEDAHSLMEHLISAEDVNIIRVYEIDFDHPPKVTITPDTVRAIIERYGAEKLVPASQTGRNAMYRAASDQPLDVVRLMFELRARDLYPQIQVNSEPHNLNQFRLRVHDTWLMNNCATSRCHGGPDAGRLILNRRNFKNDRVRYTNLLILERLSLDPEWPLINYERPDDSLIIQYGLSREDPTCRKPHPKVAGWKPAFSSVNPRLKQEAIDWIRSMMIPRPEYPVDYQPETAAVDSRKVGEPSESSRPSR